MSRKMHPNSLENLKLGGRSRRTDKIRCTVTIHPATKEWLAKGGNISGRIDEVVRKILEGQLIGIKKVEQLESQIEQLKSEIEQLKKLTDPHQNI